MKNLMIALLIGLTSTGCTSLSLKRHTLNQAQSISDLRYQQVLNCLALIADDPYALPSFAVIADGSTSITDMGMASSTTLWTMALFGFASETMSLLANRNPADSWTVDPITDPDSTRALRCACQFALYGPDHYCEDIALLMPPPHLCKNESRGVSPEGDRPEKCGSGTINQCLKPLDKCDVQQYCKPCPNMIFCGDEVANAPGPYFDVIDQLKSLPSGWLHVGGIKDFPKICCYSAHHHGKYVWVTRDGLEGLSRFTLIFLDVATINPPWLRPAAITAQLALTDSNGCKTTITAPVGKDKWGNVVVHLGKSTIAPMPRKLFLNGYNIKSIINTTK